eukprot:CAMPEP_0173183404 /NCGR_PEP_ID=MMETSP1141-20130122/8373_1 /TAXON_ID=483371 /ORGANISM="non described non described, Strain CCMP2298" /LENGTH=38 /DNA_ID= /DNA_START= /DNA_END= /DNA_ORIENTATION=
MPPLEYVRMTDWGGIKPHLLVSESQVGLARFTSWSTML